MTAVGTLWEVEVWKPHLARALAGQREAWAPEPVPDHARDEAVHASFLCLPVPVVQIPQSLGTPTLDLGWVGESLLRLEQAGRVRSAATADARYWMRVAPIVAAVA